jgi:DNA-binding NarL/FixJ family response regulator
MVDNPACTEIVQARTDLRSLAADRFSEDRAPDEDAPAIAAERFIALIERRSFLGECICRSVQPALPLAVASYSTAAELERRRPGGSLQLILYSLIEADAETTGDALRELSKIVLNTPVIVLGSRNDPELARTVIRLGAKGFIPFTLGFEIAVEAVRFVLSGGTYVPIDCLLMANRPAAPALAQQPGGVTARELEVVRAIQEGKSNKVIAFELNMRESTVKVHVRNLMKKLKARNRTDVAIKAKTSFSADTAASA